MFLKIFKLLNNTEKKKFFSLQVYFVFLSLIEVFGIISIIPLVFVISAENIDQIYNNYPILKNYLNFTDIRQFQLFFSVSFLALLIFYNLINLFCFYKFETLVEKIHTSKFAQSQGGKKIVTYTLETEPGSSLKAVNFNAAAKTGFFKGGWQNRNNRREYTPIRKIRWEKFL